MPSTREQQPSTGVPTFALGMLGPAMEYTVDAAQRSILFWDVMRQRGNQYREHLAETVPHVLDYEVELVLDGRGFDRPVNYALARVVPPPGVELDMTRRPFVIVDPRAGHGPGIGGFKADSEIGVALKAGHPCYFVGFLPDPVPGQTIGDIARAEAVFLEKVIALHPEADGKPCVVGNCQAGWAIMMLAALRPELFGPIIVAGSPLSYWAGVRGKNPDALRGGLLGGSWLTALTSDLGHGKFDGAWLVQNFESQNPANTLWTKQYNLYSKIDTEAPRYLDFERWWGGHVNLNARGDPVHRRRAVHRQQSRCRKNSNIGRRHDRPAQHPLSDRGVLLERRQHHAAPAGARMDSRSLRERRRNSILRPDDRLHHPRNRRSSGHLRLRAAWRKRSTASSRAIST